MELPLTDRPLPDLIPLDRILLSFRCASDSWNPGNVWCDMIWYYDIIHQDSCWLVHPCSSWLDPGVYIIVGQALTKTLVLTVGHQRRRWWFINGCQYLAKPITITHHLPLLVLLSITIIINFAKYWLQPTYHYYPSFSSIICNRYNYHSQPNHQQEPPLCTNQPCH